MKKVSLNDIVDFTETSIAGPGLIQGRVLYRDGRTEVVELSYRDAGKIAARRSLAPPEPKKGTRRAFIIGALTGAVLMELFHHG